MKKVNVGFIGCGRIADLHVLGYEDSPDARLLGICDTNPEILATRKKEWRVEKTYTDYREMLDDPAIDAVEIITPHKLHEVMVMDAIDARKHISLQKPMTISLKSADRMVAAAKGTDKVFKVNDMYVFYPPIVLAKKMIEDGVIGEPHFIRMKMINSPIGGWALDAATYDWRFDEFSEGRFSETFDHGHHEWATAWFLMGEVERVSAWIDSIDGILDNPVTLMWKYKGSRSYGVCDFVYAEELHIPSKYYSNDEWFEITGSKGVIFINRCTGNIFEGPAVSVFTSSGWKHYNDVRSDWADGFIDSAKNFIGAIKGEEEAHLTGDEGREILRFSFAIYNSAKKRREVYLEELDRPLPALYAWRKKRREKKESFIESFKPSRFGERLSRYAPQSKELTENFMERFDPSAVEGWEGVVGLDLTADGGVGRQKFTITVKDGKAILTGGEISESVTMTLTMPAGTWAAILMGKKKIEGALFKRQMKIEGDIKDGLKLRSAFHI